MRCKNSGTSSQSSCNYRTCITWMLFCVTLTNAVRVLHECFPPCPSFLSSKNHACVTPGRVCYPRSMAERASRAKNWKVRNGFDIVVCAADENSREWFPFIFFRASIEKIILWLSHCATSEICINLVSLKKSNFINGINNLLFQSQIYCFH